MRTRELISILSSDGATPRWRVGRSLATAVLAGGVVAAVLFASEIGLREDIGPALQSWRFDWKLTLVTVALAVAFYDCVRLANPLARGVASWLSLSLPVLVALGIAVELALTPSGTWWPRLVGSNAMFCLSTIPLLAVVPLLAAFAAMRFGAPSSPALAGAAVGRLAAAVAALLYALHCTDDSPLFVAVWYSLATLVVIAAGTLAGRWVLRW